MPVERIFCIAAGSQWKHHITQSLRPQLFNDLMRILYYGKTASARKLVFSSAQYKTHAQNNTLFIKQYDKHKTMMTINKAI